MAPSPGWPQPDVAASCRSGRIRVMKAAVCAAYGPPEVLQVRDVPRPSPKQREILVKVHATSVTVSDTYGRDGFGFARWWQRFLVRLASGYRRPRNRCHLRAKPKPSRPYVSLTVTLVACTLTRISRCLGDGRRTSRTCSTSGGP